MTHTTRVRILAARPIVPARDLDRFPAGERFEQLTQQRRLPNFGSEPTNTDYNWLIYTIRFYPCKSVAYFRRLSLGATLGAFTFKTPRASL